MGKGLRGSSGNPAAPPYSKGPYTWTEHVTFSQGVSGALSDVKSGCHVWYVDSGKSNTGGGTSWDDAFLTLAEAVTAAGNYDLILIAPNAIQTIASTGITITQTGLRIYGANAHPGLQSSALKIAAGTASMFTIGADRVEIAYLNLSQRTAYACITIGESTDAGGGIYQTYIHDCNFDGYDTATYAIKSYADTVDPVNLVVDHCYFKGHTTAAIYANGTRDTFSNNFIDVGADNTGIYVANTTGDRNYNLIHDNMFIGQAGTTTKGIEFAGNNTAGTIGVFKNLFVGDFDVTVEDNTGDPGCLNYVGSTTGGSLIDCNTSA